MGYLWNMNENLFTFLQKIIDDTRWKWLAYAIIQWFETRLERSGARCAFGEDTLTSWGFLRIFERSFEKIWENWLELICWRIFGFVILRQVGIRRARSASVICRRDRQMRLIAVLLAGAVAKLFRETRSSNTIRHRWRLYIVILQAFDIISLL